MGVVFGSEQLMRGKVREFKSPMGEATSGNCEFDPREAHTTSTLQSDQAECYSVVDMQLGWPRFVTWY